MSTTHPLIPLPDLDDRPMRISMTACRATLPAAVWQALTASERPTWHPRDCAGATVEDGNELVYVFTSRRYRQLLAYLSDLEGTNP